jgi:hypothetical protein
MGPARDTTAEIAFFTRALKAPTNTTMQGVSFQMAPPGGQNSRAVDTCSASPPPGSRVLPGPGSHAPSCPARANDVEFASGSVLGIAVTQKPGSQFPAGATLPTRLPSAARPGRYWRTSTPMLGCPAQQWPHTARRVSSMMPDEGAAHCAAGLVYGVLHGLVLSVWRGMGSRLPPGALTPRRGPLGCGA